MVDNKVIVDWPKFRDNPRYYQEKMKEIMETRMIYGDAVLEIINRKITNWRQVIENDNWSSEIPYRYRS